MAACPNCQYTRPERVSTGTTKVGTPIASYFCPVCAQMFVVQEPKPTNGEGNHDATRETR